MRLGESIGVSGADGVAVGDEAVEAEVEYAMRQPVARVQTAQSTRDRATSMSRRVREQMGGVSKEYMASKERYGCTER